MLNTFKASFLCFHGQNERKIIFSVRSVCTKKLHHRDEKTVSIFLRDGEYGISGCGVFKAGIQN